ncbi:MAG: alpha/beta hydrolase [Bacilli bacterium]|jgi:acetyl esterase/lipase|nr:alpha/beta hydrolase [Bacilli bacterium]
MKVTVEKILTNGANLTCYVMDKSKEMPGNDIRPAALIFPGGGYTMCSDREAEPVAMAFLERGFNAFVLRYTTGNYMKNQMNGTFEKALMEAEASLKYLKDNSKELGIDPKRIVTIGFSAGGHLAAALGTLGKDKPEALILGYPVTKEADVRGLGLGKVPDLPSAIDRNTPPCFIFSTQGDGLVPIANSLDFASKLSAYGIPFELHVFLTGQHGLSIATKVSGPVDDDVAKWVELAIRFIENLEKDEYPHAPRPISEGCSLDTKVGELVNHPLASKIIEKYIPGFCQGAKMNPLANAMALRSILDFMPNGLSKENKKKLEEELKGIK